MDPIDKFDMNTGVSLHFDGGLALNSRVTADEEDEAAEDEKIQAVEIKNAVVNELDDWNDTESEYSENDSRNDSPQLAHSANGDDDHRSPSQYSDVRASPGLFRPLDPVPFAGDASDHDGSSGAGGDRRHREEEQYYVDRLCEFDANNLLSGGELSSSRVDRSSFLDGDDDERGPNDTPFQRQQQQFLPNVHHPATVEFGRPAAVPVIMDDEEENRQFLAAGEHGESSTQMKYRQMLTLYSAKGRELQRLQQDFETNQRRWVEETEQHRHQLSEMKDNEQQYADQLQEYREKLLGCNGEIVDLRGQVRAMEVQHSAVSNNREELVRKLYAAEVTISGLQAHVVELEQSENLVRAKERHSAMVSSMQGRHNEDTYQLKSELEQLKEKLTKRDHEVVDLKRKNNEIGRDYETAKIESAEKVNRLLRSLEQSQEKCQKLMAGGAQPAVFETTEESAKKDRLIGDLKNELQATKQELDLFVSSSRLGVANATVVPDANKQDSTISSLKGEVERSLLCLRRKNEQLLKVQSSHQSTLEQLRECREDSSANVVKLNAAEIKLLKVSEDLSRLMESDKNRETAAQETIRRLIGEKSSLEEQQHRRQTEFRELNRSKQQLSELVRKLKEEMESAREAAERHAEEAVAKCRETCLRMHDDAVAAVRGECQQLLDATRLDHVSRVDSLTRDLDNVKTMYVKVCEEKDNLEERLIKEFEEAKSKEIENLKKMWVVVKEEEMKSIERKLQAKYKSRNKTQVGSEQSGQLEAQLASAKKLWAKEQELVVEEQVLSRVRDFARSFLSSKPDIADSTADADLEQIVALEKRVRDSEDLFKRHVAEVKESMRKSSAEELQRQRALLTEEKRVALQELESRKERETEEKLQRAKRDHHLALRSLTEAKDGERERALLLVSTERLPPSSDEHSECRGVAASEKERAVAEAELRKELSCQERLQALAAAKDLEKQTALEQVEEKLCSELEQFLVDQKQRYMSALQSMQDSHSRETSEMRKNLEAQMRQLNEDCQRFVEAASQDRDVRQGQQRLDAETEQASLAANIEILRERCRKLESEGTAVANAHQRQLREKDAQLEEARTRLEEATKETLRSAKLPSTNTHNTQEVASLRGEVARLEESKRTEIEKSETALRDLSDRHRTLKDKVRKYHRYIHAKEREFSQTLLRITEEHSAALDRVAALKVEVPQMLDGKLEQLRREFLRAALDARPSADGTGPYNSNDIDDAPGPVKRMVDDAVVDELIEKFVLSLKKAHADTLLHLNECSKLATDRIREEISLATCLVSSQQLVTTPCLSDDINSDAAFKNGALGRPARQRPSTTANGMGSGSTLSSGHGTMASGSHRSAPDPRLTGAASDTSRAPWAKGSAPAGQYWSSTPFQRDGDGAQAAAALPQPPSSLPFNLDSIRKTPKSVGDLPSELLGRLVNQRLLMSLQTGDVDLDSQVRSSGRSAGSRSAHGSRYDVTFKPSPLTK